MVQELYGALEVVYVREGWKNLFKDLIRKPKIRKILAQKTVLFG